MHRDGIIHMNIQPDRVLIYDQADGSYLVKLSSWNFNTLNAIQLYFLPPEYLCYS